MTISVLAQPSNTPPRFQITIASPAGEAFTAIALYRTAAGSTTATRVQPPAGPSPVFVYDYEAPWEAGVVYSATVTRAGVTETYTAAAATLAPAFPWLIHPTTPSLSMLLDQNSFDAMGVLSLGDESRAELKQKHRILGSEFQIVTRSGPRAAPTMPIQIATVTPAERSALIAILRDQTPLLIQTPDSWGWEFDDGYYDVGDFTLARFEQYGPTRRRVASMTLERVEAPAGTQQAQRTWTTLLSQFATWQAVSAAYATWTDELTDSRR